MSVPRKTCDVTELDRWFKPCGPCAFCGFNDKRHRLWDAIMERHEWGDSVADLAEDFDYPVDAIEAVLRIRPYEDDPELHSDRKAIMNDG